MTQSSIVSLGTFLLLREVVVLDSSAARVGDDDTDRDDFEGLDVLLLVKLYSLSNWIMP